MLQTACFRALLVCGVLNCYSEITTAALVIRVDASTNVLIENTGVVPFDFDGYSLLCNAACLSPAGWISIEDQVAIAPLDVLGSLGSGGLGFAEAAPTTFQLTELTLGSGGVLQPNASIPIGRPIDGTFSEIVGLVDDGSLTWQWTSQTFGTNNNASFAVVPEPSAFLCWTVGLIVSLVVRCRQNRSGKQC